MILLGSVSAASVLILLFLSFRISKKNSEINNLKIEGSSLREIRTRLELELNQATQDKYSVKNKLESVIVESAKHENTASFLKDSIVKLEKDLIDQKNLYSETQESLYQTKQSLELKIQEMKEFKIRVSDWEKSREEAITQAKAAIFETATKLSTELIEKHKEETKESEVKLGSKTLKLQEQFEKIVNNVSILNNEIKSSKDSVDHVKRALLSPAGAGNLAEITLENILKSSGLQNNRDFVMQYSFTTNSTEKSILRPDAVVFLPGDNVMIIDSKSSKYFTEIADFETDPSKDNISKLKATMLQHIKDLKKKNYQDFLKEHLSHKKINHISNIMFLPSEVALDKVSQIDKNFITKAWEDNIFPVGPSGLINLLVYAKFQIASHTQSENQQLIVEEVRKLLSSVSHLYDHTRKLGNSLHSTTNHFDRLAGSFNTSFLPKARNLQKLGIQSSKNKELPNNLDRLTIISSNKMDLIDVEQDPQKKLKENINE